jgi:trypsin-like peptidase
LANLLRSLLVAALLLVWSGLPSIAQEDDGSAPDATDTTDTSAPTGDMPAAPTVEPTATAVATPTPTVVTATQVQQQAWPSVVQIQTEAGQGSGVALAGGILTDAHVVQDTIQIQVVTVDGRKSAAKISRIDTGADLALLQLQTDLGLPTLDLEDLASQHIGDQLFVLGYTTRDSDNVTIQTFTQGQITAVGLDDARNNGRALVQTTAKIVQGNSGGAVVNIRGKLVGVPSFIVPIGNLQANVAVGSDTIYAFLALPADKVAPPAPTPLYRGSPLTVVVPISFLGPGWVQESDDRSMLSQGAYQIVWHMDPPGGGSRVKLQAAVVVLPSAASAEGEFEQVAPNDPNLVAINVPQVGDEDAAWARQDGTEVFITAHTRNVFLLVDESSAVQLTNAQIFSTHGELGVLSAMVNTVDSQAH